MCNHNKKPRSNQLIDLGFLSLLYREKVKKINLTQPHFLYWNEKREILWYNNLRKAVELWKRKLSFVLFCLWKSLIFIWRYGIMSSMREIFQQKGISGWKNEEIAKRDYHILSCLVYAAVTCSMLTKKCFIRRRGTHCSPRRRRFRIYRDSLWKRRALCNWRVLQAGGYEDRA